MVFPLGGSASERFADTFTSIARAADPARAATSGLRTTSTQNSTRAERHAALDDLADLRRGGQAGRPVQRRGVHRELDDFPPWTR